jgi:acyl-CoA synthetase (AMP-forming)/AMP-acid ligase II
VTGTPALDAIVERMGTGSSSPAIWDGGERTYGDLLGAVDAWRSRLASSGVGRGTVVAVHGDWSFDACAILIALFIDGAIAVPFIPSAKAEMRPLMGIAGAERLVTLVPGHEPEIEWIDHVVDNELIATFRARSTPGLVVFTSGSTGVPKGVLHDGDLLLRKFVEPRPGWRTVLFLSMDHLGGLNTLFSSLAYLGVAVCLPDRKAETVARTIAESRATLLPTTPTFLNLLSASGVYRHYDLSSIKLITYGTEAMPETTLSRVREMFPAAKLKQTYGLSELGVLGSKSEDSSSTWVRVGGPGFETRIVDGTLWIRSESNMVGYLNAPSPFDADGWMNTGDEVEVRGEYLRILGRRSDMINVGGQKVSPLDVETVVLQAPNVADVTVRGVAHPLMGHVVHATVSLVEAEDPEEAVIRLRKFCLEHLPRFKVPVRFQVVAPEAHRGARFKKVRRDPEGR